jgi:hypothetical protein
MPVNGELPGLTALDNSICTTLNPQVITIKDDNNRVWVEPFGVWEDEYMNDTDIEE